MKVCFRRAPYPNILRTVGETDSGTECLDKSRWQVTKTLIDYHQIATYARNWWKRYIFFFGQELQPKYVAEYALRHIVLID